jgi:signal transduction histidine kinase
LAFAALIEINEEPCILGLIEGVTDVERTEQTTQVEVTLAAMSRKLIQGQEEERASVVRELHNYIDRLLLLSATLGRVQHSLEPVFEISQQIAEGASSTTQPSARKIAGTQAAREPE